MKEYKMKRILKIVGEICIQVNSWITCKMINSIRELITCIDVSMQVSISLRIYHKDCPEGG